MYVVARQATAGARSARVLQARPSRNGSSRIPDRPTWTSAARPKTHRKLLKARPQAHPKQDWSPASRITQPAQDGKTSGIIERLICEVSLRESNGLVKFV